MLRSGLGAVRQATAGAAVVTGAAAEARGERVTATSVRDGTVSLTAMRGLGRAAAAAGEGTRATTAER